MAESTLKRKNDGNMGRPSGDIFFGVRRNRLDEIKRALEGEPACINARDWMERVPVMIAALGGNAPLMEWLSNIDGFDPTPTDKNGANLCDYANRSFNPDASKLAFRLVYDHNDPSAPPKPSGMA